MNNYIAIKKSKLKFKDPKEKVTASLYELVQKNCRSLPSDAMRDYIKIVPVVSLRTTYSNQVLITPLGKFAVEYDIKLAEGEKTLYNLSILSSKQFMLEAFKGGEVDPNILSQSLAYPIGITYQNNTLYLLSHIVLDDKALEHPNFKLADGYSLKLIKDLKEEDKVLINELQKSFADRLILV